MHGQTYRRRISATVQEKKKGMNLGLLKRDFRITGSGILKKIPKVFTWSLHAGIAGERLLGSTFFPTRLIENRLPQFRTKRPSRAVARSGTSDWNSFVIRA